MFECEQLFLCEKSKDNENAKDALDALQILGYNKKEIEKVIQKMDIDGMSTEDIIKNALKLL